ncbi:MAG: acetyl CoA synthetase [Candidatus Terraquivivens tikiterensis]|uniref:Acetyl CoA synthetase n=1 Tax=Candidatus Terraquivivens tikiterensis TaxID=1980982 RepID=A0A2R7Y2A4_9ARCH|nr:MAG: acetyl CoA synthetase [Candidatus Terraquivivens tikiterensis]
MAYLKYLFYPRGIAVVGASRDPSKIGSRILKNLIEYGYQGRTYPVNPNVNEIMGLKAYPSVSSIDGPVDVVVVSVPAKHVLDIIDDAGKVGVKHAVVITSGFKEVGNVELEEEVVRRANKYGMRVLGPNIFGYVYTPSKINATFGPCNVIPGNVAFVSQSGALGIALMGMTILENIGISAMISIGNKADLEDSDFLEFFEDDPNTSVILLYIEGAKDGKRFVEVASRVSLKKPIVAIKSGRTEAGARAAVSHTGALAGGPAIWEAAFRQSGILFAKSVEEAFDWVKALSWNPMQTGDRLIIITNGGGAGVQATDTLAENGISLTKPPQELVEKIKKFTPPFASFTNPIDLTGMALDEWYYETLLAALKNPDVHAITVLYCQTAVTDPMKVAQSIVDAVRDSGIRKPKTVAMIGGVESFEAIKYLTKNKIPAYPTPERAAAAMASIYKYIKLRNYIAKRLGAKF